MGHKAGLALKSAQWFLRFVQFCCCAVVLALFSYFLAHLHRNNLPINNHLKAVEGISGLGVLYTLLALIFLCCVAGVIFASAIAILLDICFAGAFIYVASRLGGGTRSCDANLIETPIGNGNPRADSLYSNACRMEKACLAVSIIAIFFFIFSAITEVFLARNHRREKRFGPSPHNNYTSGSGTKPGSTRRSRFGAGAAGGGFLGRLMSKRSRRNTGGVNGDELPHHTAPEQVRDSYATDATAVGSHHAPTRDYNTGVGGTNAYNKYDQPGYGAGTTGPYQQESGIAPNELPAQGVDHAHYPDGNYAYGDGTYNTGTTGTYDNGYNTGTTGRAV